MNLSRTMVLFMYEVQYIDRREPLPRKLHSENIIINGGRINALQRLGMNPAGYIIGLYEKEGYTVASVKKREKREVILNLNNLWETSPIINMEDRFKKEGTSEESQSPVKSTV